MFHCTEDKVTVISVLHTKRRKGEGRNGEKQKRREVGRESKAKR